MVIETLKVLIEIPSVYGNEKEIADFIEKFLKKEAKLEPIRINNTVVAHTELKEGRKTIALVGHLDTVPGENELTGQLKEGRLYGLGASDMKAGDAVILEIARLTGRLEPRFNLVFILYEKEEGPFEENGLKPLFEEEKNLMNQIDLALVLEPTDNVVQIGCLGVIHAWFTFKGKRAHSARPWEGENAIHKGWKLLKFLDERKPEEIVVGNLNYYEVLNATMVDYKGGRNIIPEEFRVNLNFRFSPLKSPEEAVKELKKLAESVNAEVEVTDLSPAAKPCQDNPILKELIEMFKLKTEPKQAWTDVAQFSQHGIDAVNFGPGQPHQAHQRNEYVEIAKVKENYNMLRRFLF